MKRNKFKRALHHLNKKNVVESAPTNSTLGVFSITPSGVGPVGWTDRTFTTDISGNPLPKLPVADFTVGENPENAAEARDTSGLFEDDGTIKTLTPPGDNSYILGPFSSMWYAWGNFTTLGYIRQSDRKMVNLGTITGKLSDWDGSSINSYGQLTLEQALWFKDVKKFGDIDNDPANHNYRAFYPGPPSNVADSNGRYLCVIAASRQAGGEETRPAPPVNPTQKGAMGADDNFSAQSGRNKRGSGMRNRGREGANFSGDQQDNQRGIGAETFDEISQGNLSKLSKATLNVLDGFAIQQQLGDYMFKGLPKDVPYLPDFTGAGPKIPFLNPQGKKWADILPFGKQLAGDNYATQYFTPSYHKALDYAKADGTIVVMPKTQPVRGLKNPLKRSVSRGFGLGDIEKVVKSSDAVANKNLTKVLKVSDPNTSKVLKDLAAKGIKNNKVLSRIGRAVPFLNAGLVAADVTSRIKSGDTFGAVLGAAQIIPGPIGWVSLAAQTAYDVEGHFNKNGFKNTLVQSDDVFKKTGRFLSANSGKRIKGRQRSEGYLMEQDGESNNLSPQQIGKQLVADGLPEDKNEFIKTMGTYLTLLGVNPQFLSILLLSIGGKKLSPEQDEYVKNNIPKIAEMMAVRREGQGGKVSDKKQVKESTFNKKNLLREIVIPEAKKKYKVKPKVLGHPSNKTLSNQMKDTTPNVAFKKEIPVWSMDQKIRNARSSQEKKNEVLEYLGSSGDHWEYMTKTIKEHNKKIIKLNYGGKKKKVTRKEQVDKDTLVFMEDELGNKSSVLQSKINEMQAEAGDKEMFAKYYEMYPQKKSLFKEVVKRGVFDYKGKPSMKGYPDKEPAQLDPNTGMHPEYGKKVKHDKLDPHSAEGMPMQGDPEIDANISKNVDPEKKKRKSRILSQPNG